MRLLHTSDWHLGQTLHNFERSYEHQCFLDWLLDTLVTEQTDCLLISGDIFDSANPSAASQKQLYTFLQQAKSRSPHLNIVIIAGNHDSPGRLEAPGPLLQMLDTAVVGHISRNGQGEINLDRLVLPLNDRKGDVAAWCIAIPFLRPGDVPRVESDDPYMDGIALLYQQALQVALCKRQPGQAIIALGHCHMSGSASSVDSERRIVIGGSDALSSNVFDPAIAYAALGHLHLAQEVGKQPHLRYCGSPLPMSFSEIAYPHQVLRVDLEGETVKEIVPLRVPRAVELLRVPAQPGQVDDVLTALRALALPEVPEQAWPYLEVRVLLETPEPALRSRIEAALEGKQVRLAKIEMRQAGTSTGTATPISLDELERLQPADIFERLYQRKFDGAPPADLVTAFAELMAAPIEGSSR